jgi:HK97 family phage prohead protease
MFATDFKAVPFRVEDLKADGDKWTLTGLASTFGNLDHTNDVVMRGAFDKTLASGRTRRFLWQHDVREPLGVEQSMRVTDEGLLGTWKISKTARGIDARELIMDGALDSLSIGYVPNEFEYDDAGVRKLLEIDLLEVSLVTIPANDMAVVTGLKSNQPLDMIARQIIANLQLFTGEVKALHDRRTSEGRKLTERHVQAIKDFLSYYDGSYDELMAIANPAEAKAEANAPDPEVEAKGEERTPSDDGQSAPSADLSIRLALRERAFRLRQRGILERMS